MREGKNLILQSISEWQDCYLDYDYLKIFISVIMKLTNESIQMEETLQSQKNISQDNESKQSNSEVKLESNQIENLKNSIKDLQSILEEINKLFYESYESEVEECRIFCFLKEKEVEERFRLCVIYASIVELQDKRMRRVLITFIEYTYIEAAYLKKMEEANMEAERKILKKHKKYAQKMIKTPKACLEEKLQLAKVKELVDQIEDFYVEFCFSIQKKKAKNAKKKLKRDYLRSLTTDTETSNKDSFIFGLWVGIFMAVIIFMALLISYLQKSVQTDPIFNRDFPTWRGIAYIIFYLWIIGLNVFCFEYFKISHRIILDFNEHHYETSTGIFKIAGFLSTVFAAVFTIYALNIADIVSLGNFPSRYLALIVWGFFLLFVFNPLPISYFRSRVYILKLLLRIIVSPFIGVPFVIAWGTDQLLSLITPFEDLAYTICYYFSLDFTDLEVKNNNCRQPAKVVVFVYATIIFMYRILQCIRQGYDKKKYWKELQFFNTVKYLFSLLTLIFSYLWKAGNQNIFAAWLTFAIASTIYSYVWDLKVDWALLERKAPYCLLREKLAYHHRSYYFMMVLNLVLRLAWVLTLSPNITDKTFGSPEIFRLITGALEIIRRGIWNLLRIEKQHIKNCEQFKALPTIRGRYQSEIRQKIEQNKDKLSFPTAERIVDNELELIEEPKSETQQGEEIKDHGQLKWHNLKQLRSLVSLNQKNKKIRVQKLEDLKTKAHLIIFQSNS